MLEPLRPEPRDIGPAGGRSQAADRQLDLGPAAGAAAGRDQLPTADIVDSPSDQGTATVGPDNRGYDAGKPTNGRKRHVVVGLPRPAARRDGHRGQWVRPRGGRGVLARFHAALPGVRLVWADGGDAGKLAGWAKVALCLLVDIVRKRDGQRGFEVLPRRRVVDSTFSWITR